MVTIYDVAKQAGVSAATVSRVFSGATPVTSERALAVRAAAEELGFVANRNARRLRTNSSEIIAMVVPDISNPFFTALTRAVGDVARLAGYSVMLCNTDENPDREQEYLRVAAGEPVAGIIMIPVSTSDLSWVIEREIPVVCVDRHPVGAAVDTVVADNVASSAIATRLLLQAGHKRLACITGPEEVETSNLRRDGWAQAIRERTGAEPDPALIQRAGFVDAADSERAALKLMSLPTPPDAIFAANNTLATGTLRTLARLGLLPPAIGLVSFGGPPQMLLPPPGLIVTHLPTRAMGSTAAHMLLDRIRGLTAPARSVVLPVTLDEEAPE